MARIALTALKAAVSCQVAQLVGRPALRAVAGVHGERGSADHRTRPRRCSLTANPDASRRAAVADRGVPA
jgi:hypothetical protein